MTDSQGAVRTFRTPAWVKAVVSLAAAVFVAGGVVSYRVGGWSWTTLASAGLIALGIAGWLDVVTQRVELHHDRLVVVRNLRKATYPRSACARATWGKGVPVTVQLTSGTWVELPGVGPSAKGMVNALRAWIGS
jgi:hypothetical protein